MNTFQNIFFEFLQSYNIPEVLIFLFWNFIGFCFIAILMLFAVIILVLFERKYLAFFTRRKGPNRVGFCGCLQTVADAIKLLFKENILPKNAEKLIYYIAPLLVFVPIMTVWVLIPFSSFLVPYSSVVGLLLFFAILSLPIIGILFAGYSSGNNYAYLGGIRSCIQAISSELPIFLVLASIVILTGTLELDKIVEYQKGTLFSWNIFPDLLGFIIFFICSLIVMNRIPFDFPEAESELVAGYNSEYSGMKFAMFFLGEYALTFIMSAFMVTLFFGGYNSPIGFYIVDLFNIPIILNEFLKNIEQFFWLMFKSWILIMLIMWIRATYPRLRTDKTLELSWYILLPLSIFNIFVIVLIKYCRGIL